ncbi:Hypp7486 [Branchiostoma lanceolatum]|uniref:Hypp7486 protein n=1 Tax=Branchiostoma lanceolatum TaxID=7740 RepID=A0A8J9Z1J2_BRALA|nr:Hypp7486 [Branchiostoma lanceolatum]
MSFVDIPTSKDVITVSWIQEVLSRYFSHQGNTGLVIVKSLDNQGAVGPGQGFLSNRMALVAMGTVDGTPMATHLMVKMSSDDPAVCDLVHNLRFDSIEVNYYNLIVPAFRSEVEKLEGAAGSKVEESGEEEKHAAVPLPVPRCYHAAYDKSTGKSVLLLENLQSKGFFTRKFSDGLGLEEMRLAVSALAKLHAISYSAMQRGTLPPAGFDWLFDTSEEAAKSAITQVFHDGLEQFATTFPDQPELASMLRRLGERVPGILGSEEEGPLMVLCHGDCWANNIMFKVNDAGVPIDAMLVDWQCVCRAPPSNDLALLLLSSTDRSLRQQHTNDLLAHYHSVLTTTVQKCGLDFPPYNLDMLCAEYHAERVSGLLQCVASYDCFVADQACMERLRDSVEELRESNLI